MNFSITQEYDDDDDICLLGMCMKWKERERDRLDMCDRLVDLKRIGNRQQQQKKKKYDRFCLFVLHRNGIGGESYERN